jgi:hypothetical protein
MHVKDVVGSMLNISLIIDSLNFYVLFVVHYENIFCFDISVTSVCQKKKEIIMIDMHRGSKL